MPTFDDPSLYMAANANATRRSRGVVNFIRWSSALRGRHRAIAANPTIRLRGNRAHTETTVLGQLKKSQQNRAPACESCHITAKRFGPAEFTEI
jgi:hypothetical protein